MSKLWRVSINVNKIYYLFMCRARNGTSRTQCMHVCQKVELASALGMCGWAGGYVNSRSPEYFLRPRCLCNFSVLSQNTCIVTVRPFAIYSFRDTAIFYGRTTDIATTQSRESVHGRDQSQKKCNDVNEDTVPTWYKNSYTASLIVCAVTSDMI